MTPLTFGLYLAYLCLGTIAQATNLNSSTHQEIDFVSANVGDSVTLQCFYGGNAVMFYWYKQTLGQTPRLISTFYKYKPPGDFHDEFKNNARFTLDTGTGKNHLTISDLCISDSASYYCTGAHAYNFGFLESITLSVKGSGLSIPALVHQSASETIQPGDSVALNCIVHTGTCDGEHSVYWFQNSGESHPGLIYTNGDRNDQCERRANTQTHTCVYNLPMKSLKLSHAGTYYCAVASCGHILFGNGTKLDFEHKVDSSVLVYYLIGSLAFTTILVVVLAYAAYTMKNRNSCKCKDSRPSASSPSNADDYQDSDSMHYAALREHKGNRSRRQRDDTLSDCVYSSVKVSEL